MNYLEHDSTYCPARINFEKGNSFEQFLKNIAGVESYNSSWDFDPAIQGLSQLYGLQAKNTWFFLEWEGGQKTSHKIEAKSYREAKEKWKKIWWIK